MSMNQPSAPGFAIQPASAPGYPPVQQQPGYPGNQQPTYPAYSQGPQHYPQQPFPGPMAPIPPGQQNIQWVSGNLMNYLSTATAFNVKQKIELLEMVVGWETGNKYSVTDQSGNKVFQVIEETGCLSRICCGKFRPFHLSVKDTSGVEVMNFSRNLDCGAAFCGLCCADEVKVATQGGQVLGAIQEECGCFYPCFQIKNSSGQAVLRLEGPMCVCGQVTFQVLDLQGNQVGAIKKEWGGIIREVLTDADSFSVTFPPNIDPAVKATLLGALFMIDFHYFERSGNNFQKEGGRRLLS